MCFVVGILCFVMLLVNLLYTVSVIWLCIPLGLFGLFVGYYMRDDSRAWSVVFYIVSAVVILLGILFRDLSVGTAIDNIIEFLVFWN